MMTNHPATDEDALGVLLFETSPYGTVDAIVQHDGRSTYFYLNGKTTSSKPFGMRACWVRNLKPGPLVMNDQELSSGIPPMLPRTCCRPGSKTALPAPDDLRIVWLEEGTGAALQEYCSDTKTFVTLAVIPPWSGVEGFHGYAADCAEESPVCWPMPDHPQLFKRIENSVEFWDSFSRTDRDPFGALQSTWLATFQRFIDTTDLLFEPHYFAIDGGKFPPRGLVHFQHEQRNIWSTVAMSLCPQPMVELFSNHPGQQRRIELVIDWSGRLDDASCDKVSQWLSGLASFPWRNFTWFGHGHTCQMNNVLPGFEAALFANDSVVQKTSLDLPSFRGDPIQLLWLVPLTGEQCRRMASQPNAVDEFLNQKFWRK
jgi:hypothetical protein